MQFINLSLTLFFLHSLFLQGNVIVAQGSAIDCHHDHKIVKKLFVFGDSYADTGNNPIESTSSWKEPYGITFPGQPSGRYSDGRVLTDFMAKYLAIKSPAPYKFMKNAGKSIGFGINFAYGGTGVFDTLNTSPNMSRQISFLESVINDENM